ncbi:MAG TPA: translation initiation factor IF-3 [Phycisphaerales bacterium]|nr:translation initiation factor IF-3 [Phycisphaerales bacterium]HCD35364.1 translation initiation factor IF-3 [Phycisphaerales bacterium]
MASRSFRPRQSDSSAKRLRVNDYIRTPTVFLVDEDNEKIGVVNTDVAKNRARDAGLDLVEVAPQAQPPVCRIMDYGKWKYQQSKKEQKAKSHSKTSELKEVRLRPKIDPHDLGIKTNKATEFLKEGNKVQFTMLFRGREMAHQDLGMRTMQGIIDLLAPISKMETPPRMAGRRMTMILAPDKVTPAEKRKADKPAAPKPAPKPAPVAAAAAEAQSQNEQA